MSGFNKAQHMLKSLGIEAQAMGWGCSEAKPGDAVTVGESVLSKGLGDADVN